MRCWGLAMRFWSQKCFRGSYLTALNKRVSSFAKQISQFFSSILTTWKLVREKMAAPPYNPVSQWTKHLALRSPTTTECELSITTTPSGHQVFNLSYSQLRLLTLEGARILACWPTDISSGNPIIDQ